MGLVPHPSTLFARLVALEREVQALRKRAGLSSAAIATGALEVLHPSGAVAARLGEHDIDGALVFGLVTRRLDDSISMRVLNSWDLWDAAGNMLAAEDPGGQGLARPWLPIAFTDPTTVNPDQTTTSATFVTLQQARYAKQHPQLYVAVLVRSSAADTTGEVQVAADGVAVGLPAPIAGSQFEVVEIGPAPLDGVHMQLMDLQVQARRTAGTGTIGVRVVGAYASQT